MNFRFLAEYIKDIRSVGAVAPSSRFLARKMVESIDFERAKVIIEYGPGTGVFTAEIVKRMKPGTRLLVIETNQTFYQKLYQKYKSTSGVNIINASAEHVDLLKKEYSLDAPDYVVSGLPFAALPVRISASILQSTSKLLGDKGEFIAFQYTLLKKGFFESYFDDVKISREFRNIPPAYIIRCRHPKLTGGASTLKNSLTRVG